MPTKCKICGAEVERELLMEHIGTAHPETLSPIPSRFRHRKCWICGAEVQTQLWTQHVRTIHPDYWQYGWHNRLGRRIPLILVPMLGLVLLDLLRIPLLSQTLQYALPAYLILVILILAVPNHRKTRAIKDAWRKTHPPTTNEE